MPYSGIYALTIDAIVAANFIRDFRDSGGPDVSDYYGTIPSDQGGVSDFHAHYHTMNLMCASWSFVSHSFNLSPETSGNLLFYSQYSQGYNEQNDRRKKLLVKVH